MRIQYPKWTLGQKKSFLIFSVDQGKSATFSDTLLQCMIIVFDVYLILGL